MCLSVGSELGAELVEQGTFDELLAHQNGVNKSDGEHFLQFGSALHHFFRNSVDRCRKCLRRLAAGDPGYQHQMHHQASGLGIITDLGEVTAIDSEVGQETVFTVYIPRLLEPVPDADSPGN